MTQHSPKDPAKIAAMAGDADVDRLVRQLFDRVNDYRYSYNFTWLGRPVIQYPQDLVALQEIIWRVKPDVIVETGIAHGGSLVFSASMLELLGGDGEVVGVDIEIRPHNREAIETHPMARRIAMIEGSSVDDDVVAQVRERVAGRERVLVVLDSNHTHEHVARELELYGELVTPGSYLVVMDTVIDDMPAEAFPDRPWGPGNNPKTAVHEFLARSDRFEIDREISDKLLITVAPDGYLKCLA
jgi:cephalosporin hydroxylase